MTDEQIIKALECCFTNDFGKTNCNKCVFYTATAKCMDDMQNAVIALFNRQKEKIKEFDGKIVIQQGMIDYQKAEIERMEKELTEYKLRLKMSECTVDEIKSEAIKDFAKRLKSKLNDLEFRTKTHRKTVPTKFCDDNANWVMHECVPEEIDNLVKEMTEVEEVE